MINEYNWKDITKKSYNSNADEFAKHTTIFRGKLDKWINDFVSRLSRKSLVLDIGCGAGRDAKFFSDFGLQVAGIDFSEKLIDIAKKKVPEGEFYVMDFENLEFSENEFDGIWASASLLHIPKKRLLSVFKKIYFVLKKDGLFYSSFRVGEGEKFTEEKRGNAILKRFYSYYEPAELRKLLEKSKFNIIKEELNSIDSRDWAFFLTKK